MDTMNLKYSDNHLKEILMQSKSIALILASYNKEKPSFRVMEYLLDNGYKVFPVNNMNPNGKIHSRRVF